MDFDWMMYCQECKKVAAHGNSRIGSEPERCCARPDIVIMCKNFKLDEHECEEECQATGCPT